MIRILTVIGARPQIIKAAALSRTIINLFSNKIHESILHTGQHYDNRMSQVFFEELNIPEPDYNLNVGSGLHGEQTAKMIKGIESVLLSEKPDFLVLYGDTNSTLAGAIAASKLHIPVIHIEAGLRSHNKSMPEEINRLLCDHISTVLCCPTKKSLSNLYREGFAEHTMPPWNYDNPVAVMTGDLMLDNSIYYSNVAETSSNIISELNLSANNYFLATIHRPQNTDDPGKLNPIFKSFVNIADKYKIPVILPLHPRTAKSINTGLNPSLFNEIKNNPLLRIIQPVTFLDMINLEKNCRLVLTDSGGVQKEAFFFKKPCIILRTETEWVEITECGNAIVTDSDEKLICKSVDKFILSPPSRFPAFFGNGTAAQCICQLICDIYNN